MADISQIMTPDGTSYDIKDTTSRSGLADKMDKVNPTGSGKMLFNAASDSTGGTGSVCLSYNSNAKTTYSACIGGHNLVSGRANQTVFGIYNEENASSVVVVGWGSSTTPKNIFTLSTAGAGNFASTIEATGLGATLKQAVIDAIYPVGSIYMTVTDDTAAKVKARFGGTWVAWGAGRVPVGVDSDDTNFNTVEKTGGKSTVTLTAAQSGVPAHTHETAPMWAGASGTGTNYVVTGYPTANKAGEYNIKVTTNTAKNASAAHTNLQPYITCYMWKRTA